MPKGHPLVLREGELFEFATCLVVEAVDGLKGQGGDVEPVVEVGYGSDFFLCGHFGIGQEVQELGFMVGIGAAQGVDEQEGLFATENVASDFLAKHSRVAVDIEVVVLQLEGQANFFGKTVEGIGIGVGGLADEGTHLDGTG